jgi:type II secretory pathway component PulF
MTQFRYTAKDNTGREVSGTIAAETEKDVSKRLAEQGFETVAVEPAHARPVKTSALKAVRGRVSIYALAPFYRQFAVLYRAGVPFQNAMDSLSRQTNSKRLSAILRDMGADTLEGRSLYSSMARHAPAFGNLELAIIKAGEEGGFLEGALLHVADYIDREIELRRLLRSVLAWPMIVLIVAVFMPPVGNLVMKSLTGQPGTLGGPLSDVRIWAAFVGVLVALVIAFRLGMRSASFRIAWDTFRLHVPFVGGTIHMLVMAQFGRALGALYNSGVALPSAIRLAGEASGSEVVAQNCYSAARRIEGGAPVADTLAATRVFSPMLIDMLRTGENTGEMSQMLNSVATFSEEEGKVRTKQAGMAFGVFIYLLVACYVAYMVFSYYSGYFASALKSAE